MKKFVVKIDKCNQMKAHAKTDTGRMFDWWNSRSDRFEEDLKAFDSLKEAEAFFEESKELCSSSIAGSFIWFDLLLLTEEEWDEDDEFIDGGDIHDYYIQPVMNVFKDARRVAGFTQEEASKKLRIPKRTIENWESGSSTPPDYVTRLVLKEYKRI